jgi:hypothetical protein
MNMTTTKGEGGLNMFGKKKVGLPPFIHDEGCPILAADPGVDIQWSEIERGYFVATCVCTTEHYREPRTRPARLDPLDPKTSHHMPQCEFVGVTDPAVLKVLLKIQERDGYSLVECGGCAGLWQVPFFGSESVG